jgi:hypothetical protein
MCKISGENMDHLLLNCDIARELWAMIFCLFRV